MGRNILLWILALMLMLCPVWAGAEEQEQPEGTPEVAEETPEPTATPKPATEKAIRAAFEAYLKEGRGIGANVLKTSEFQLRYDEEQAVWLATLLPDRETMTTPQREWMRAYEGTPGIRWDRLTALYSREGEQLDDAALAAYEGVTWPVANLISTEKAAELARLVTGLQYELKEKPLAALTSTVLLRAPKGDEDPDYYEFHVEFRDGKEDDQGAVPWSYLAKVDAQNGQVLMVLQKGEAPDYGMGR